MPNVLPVVELGIHFAMVCSEELCSISSAIFILLSVVLRRKEARASRTF